MKDVYSSVTQKSTAETTGNSAKIVQSISRRKECTIVEPHKTGDKKIYEEYKMEATIQNKIKLNKCDAYTKRNTKIQVEKILCVSGKMSSKKRRKTEGDRRRNKSTDKLLKPPNKEER